MNKWIVFLLVLIFGVVMIITFIYWLQCKMLFIPNREIVGIPDYPYHDLLVSVDPYPSKIKHIYQNSDTVKRLVSSNPSKPLTIKISDTERKKSHLEITLDKISDTFDQYDWEALKIKDDKSQELDGLHNNPDKSSQHFKRYHDSGNVPSNDYISVWHFSEFPEGKVVLYCHGNTGNISHRTYMIELCQKFKLNLVLWDYRGYGQSNGILNQKSIKEDALTAYNYTQQYYPPDKIIIWGESLGGSMATYIASRCHCSTLLLMCTFSSLDDILVFGGKISNHFGYIISYVFDTLPQKSWIKSVKAPVAIIHSREDELIPYKCSEILYENISHDNKIHLEILGGHSSPNMTKEQLFTLFDFAGVDHSFDCDDFVQSWIENIQKLGKYCKE